ncbi:MAG TPA: endonuclease/exonuclease/phosphatase family protein [Phycisphaerae bacterium]|nr:endonuclease/exonuclease/phosphatase family protein [Phycisphaerae bacterium]
MTRKATSPGGVMLTITGLCAALAGCLCLLACSGPARRPRKAPEGVPALAVMTFNVNFGLAGDSGTLAAVRGAGADAVFLQETTPLWESAIRRELSDAYPYMEFRHCRGAGGMAVLSRRPFQVRDYVPSPSGWFPAMRVVLQSPLGPVQALQVHLHPPVSERGSVASGYLTTGPVRKREIEAFLERLEPGMPTLVLGDFNENYDGQAAGVLYERGIQSVLREYEPSARTWRWRTGVGTLRKTLDHIFYGPGLEPLEARVIDRGASDHLPVLAVFGPAGVQTKN